MVQITKEEVAKIRKEFPSIHIKRTVNKYYVEENVNVLAAIGRLPRKSGGAAC